MVEQKSISEMTDVEFIEYVSQFGKEKRERLIAERDESKRLKLEKEEEND